MNSGIPSGIPGTVYLFLTTKLHLNRNKYTVPVIGKKREMLARIRDTFHFNYK